MIFNTHSHVNDKTNQQITNLLENCSSYNVSDICVVGYNYNSSLRALEVASLFKNTHAICGLQPEEVESYNGDFSDFKVMWDNPLCICIGEIGLDYYYGIETKELQLKYFEEQLKLACNYKKPIEIHCREAHEDTFNLLNKYKDKLDGIILHCYTGSVEMAKRYLSIGAYISISGVVTFKNAIKIKEVVKEIPLDRILVETDDPYLAPTPFRGQENQPAYVSYVVKEIANIKQISEKEVEETTYKNAKKVFHL